MRRGSTTSGQDTTGAHKDAFRLPIHYLQRYGDLTTDGEAANLGLVWVPTPKECLRTIVGQEGTSNRQTVRYIEVPRQEVLMVVVQQPESPLRIEGVTCLFGIDRAKTVIRYRVKNISTRAIASFSLMSWDSGGAGGTLPLLMPRANRVLRPGEVLDSIDEEVEVYPLTEELRKKLKQEAKGLFEGKMRQVYFLLVDQVQFADGTTFKDQMISKALSEYLFNHTTSRHP